MPVSALNSQVVYDALKANGIRLLSVLPETWLVHLVSLADEDPDMVLVRLAKEEEGVGISAGAHLAGVKSAMLLQNHGLLASINGIVSLAQLYRIPLLMLVSQRGGFGEEHPWQTEGGGVTEHVLDALALPQSSHIRAAWRHGVRLGRTPLRQLLRQSDGDPPGYRDHGSPHGRCRDGSHPPRTSRTGR